MSLSHLLISSPSAAPPVLQESLRCPENRAHCCAQGLWREAPGSGGWRHSCNTLQERREPARGAPAFPSPKDVATVGVPNWVSKKKFWNSCVKLWYRALVRAPDRVPFTAPSKTDGPMILANSSDRSFATFHGCVSVCSGHTEGCDSCIRRHCWKGASAEGAPGIHKSST